MSVDSQEIVKVCVCNVFSLGGLNDDVCEDRCQQMGYSSQLFGTMLHYYYQACCISQRREEAHPRAYLCGLGCSFLNLALT